MQFYEYEQNIGFECELDQWQKAFKKIKRTLHEKGSRIFEVHYPFYFFF